MVAETWSLLGGMLGSPGPEKLTYDWKGQLAALSGSCCDPGGSALPALVCLQPVLDVRIAAWLIKPDSRDASDNPSVLAVRSLRLPLYNLSGRMSHNWLSCRGNDAAHLSTRGIGLPSCAWIPFSDHTVSLKCFCTGDS